MPLGLNQNYDSLFIQFMLIAVLLLMHCVTIGQMKRSNALNTFMTPIFTLLPNALTIHLITHGYTASIGMVLIAFFGIGAGASMLISDLLLWKLARWLNKVRKDKWMKEMEYVYLLLGCVGIAGLVNRLDSIENRITSLNGPRPSPFRLPSRCDL